MRVRSRTRCWCTAETASSDGSRGDGAGGRVAEPVQRPAQAVAGVGDSEQGGQHLRAEVPETAGPVDPHQPGQLGVGDDRAVEVNGPARRRLGVE